MHSDCRCRWRRSSHLVRHRWWWPVYSPWSPSLVLRLATVSITADNSSAWATSRKPTEYPPKPTKMNPVWKGALLKMRLSLALTAVLFFPLFTFAQQATETADAVRHLDRYRMSRIPVLMDDFGELGRYRDANASLAAPTSNESRVIFFGDSITDAWKLPDSFPGKPYINRGISGQTTPQMLIRFRQDVID